MRKNENYQLPLTPSYLGHDHARELAAISEILDANPEMQNLVHHDLIRGVTCPGTGREGMSTDQVLRTLIVKQMNGYSYTQLEFHLADSSSYRAFCRFGIAFDVPKKSTLQENIKRLRPETLEAINRVLVGYAADVKIEKGRKVRIDATVVESDIHNPMDNNLLYDVVRVLCRLMKKTGYRFTDHRRRAKRRHLGIVNAKNKREQARLYKDLFKVTRKTIQAGSLAAASSDSETLALELRHFCELGNRILGQAERRVLHGESVPASEKIVSIFEPHTDIIRKNRRETLYGHKINLSVGASGLVTDCVIEEGNPGDSTRAVPMVERQVEIYGRPPRQVSFDGCYASKDNLDDIKSLGVKDVAFSKKRGLSVAKMVKSAWVYRQLKRFRAGIESWISFLKRCFGLGRCTWKGLESFHVYVWGSVLSANLLTLARHRLA